MFKTRLLSGIVLVIIALLTIMSGGYVLLLTLLCVSLIGMRELYNAMGVHKSGMDLLELAGYLGAVLYYGTVFLGFEKYGMMAVILSLVLLMFVYVFTYPKYQAEQVMSAFFGLVYVAVMLSFILLTRNLENGHLLVWLIFFCSWGCDTCAYCSGMLLGKHKLAPVLSPKKSIEGAIGGTLGSAILGLIYAWIFGSRMHGIEEPVIACTVACAIAAVISQIGDLAASAIKRNHKVKDYGHIIPGHGGILDRFDSMIFTAPAIYFVLTFLG